MVVNKKFHVGSQVIFLAACHSCCHLSWQAALSHMEKLNWLVVQWLQKAARLIRKAGEGGDKKELQQRQMHHWSLQFKSLSLFSSFFLSISLHVRLAFWTPVLSCYVVIFVLLSFHPFPLLSWCSLLSISPNHTIQCLINQTLALHFPFVPHHCVFIFIPIWRAHSISNMYYEAMWSSDDFHSIIISNNNTNCNK